MPGMSFGQPGGYLTANNRFAQMLGQQQSANNGTVAGGLADVVRLGLTGYLLGKDQRDLSAADEAFTKGMSAKPWTNPDTGTQSIPRDMGDMQGPPQMVPTAQAGGMSGALQSMQGMQGNPYAGRYARELMMGQMQQDEAASARQAELMNAITLKQTPGAPEAPKQPTSVQEYEYARQNGFEGSFQEWQAIGGSTKTPANVQEWQFYSQLPPELRDQYLTMKRAGQWRDAGDRQVLPSQSNPAGPPTAEIPVGLPPDRTVKDGQIITMPAVPGAPPAAPQAPMPQGQPVPPPMGAVPPPAAPMPSQAMPQAPGGIGVTELPQAPADREAAAKREQGVQRAGGIVLDEIGRIFTALDDESRVLPAVGSGSAAPAMFGETAAGKVAGYLQTIKANVGFDRLNQMRQESPTGGALGAVNNQEMVLLQSVLGSLDQSRSEADFRYNMKRLKNTYLDIVHGPGNGPPREDLEKPGGNALFEEADRIIGAP